MSYPIVKCERHLPESGYAVCIHVIEGQPAAYHKKPTRADMGQLLCADCLAGIGPLKISDAVVICATCARENKYIPGVAPIRPERN